MNIIKTSIILSLGAVSCNKNGKEVAPPLFWQSSARAHGKEYVLVGAARGSLAAIIVIREVSTPVFFVKINKSHFDVSSSLDAEGDIGVNMTSGVYFVGGDKSITRIEGYDIRDVLPVLQDNSALWSDLLHRVVNESPLIDSGSKNGGSTRNGEK